MSSTDDEYRQLLNEMMNKHISYQSRLLDLQVKGVTVGAPSIDDIIQREQDAIDNLSNALALFNSLKR